MEERIKTTIPDFEGEKKEEDKDTAMYLMIIFIPIIAIIILCFKYQTLRIISLCLSGFAMGYLSYKSYKARDHKFNKDIVTQLILVVLTALGIFYKFFGDLVLSYWAVALSSMLLMIILKIENEKQKVLITYSVFFAALITAIILNYSDISLLFKNLNNYF